MNLRKALRSALLSSLAAFNLCVAVSSANAQSIVLTAESERALRIPIKVSQVPLPPGGVPLPGGTPAPAVSADFQIPSIKAQVQITDQVAKVQLSQTFQNPTSSTLEAEFLFPLPDAAAVSDITLLVDGRELPGKLMPRDAARSVYEAIVRSKRDPALVEFIGQGLYKTSVFPIPAGASRTVELRYSQVLTKISGLIDFQLPLASTRQLRRVIQNLEVTIALQTTDALKTLYSPSHQIDIKRPDNQHATCTLSLKDVVQAENLRLMFGCVNGLVGTSFVSYRPNPNEEGYFLLLASPDVAGPAADTLPKTVLFVCDKSGSMGGTKIQQTRDALKYFLGRLQPEDTFNIIVYDSVVESFRPELQHANTASIQAALGFVEGIHAGGSTNISQALDSGFRQLTDTTRPTYVMFLTDGLPTAGEQNELKIAALVQQVNAVRARMFNFGVGFDVNSRLLDRLTREQRGQSVYVSPSDNLETVVASFYDRLNSPVLVQTAAKVEFDTPANPAAAAAISRTYPRELNDLFRGEQLVYVGRYSASGAAKITLSGKVAGKDWQNTVNVDFVAHSKDETNGFVEKLWATRRCGEIIDQLDLNGQNKELVDELVQLSQRHGIMTPYTSFLADEGTNLADLHGNSTRALSLSQRGLAEQAGRGGFEQRRFKQLYSNAKNESELLDSITPSADSSSPRAGTGPTAGLPAAGGYALGVTGADAKAMAAKQVGKNVVTLDTSGNVVATNKVRQIGQKTFFYRNNRWEDSAATEEQVKNAKKVVQFSDDYFALANKHAGSLAQYLTLTEPAVINLGTETWLMLPPEAEAPAKGS